MAYRSGAKPERKVRLRERKQVSRDSMVMRISGTSNAGDVSVAQRRGVTVIRCATAREIQIDTSGARGPLEVSFTMIGDDARIRMRQGRQPLRDGKT
jgi:hypothetical protein